MSGHKPAEVFCPGEFIRDELGARGWTPGDLAAITGRSPAEIGEVLSGGGEITPGIANDLGEVFGTDPRFWLDLDAAYRPRARMA
jgi:HTH-type transcriptional regulator/antitoxin HigA